MSAEITPAQFKSRWDGGEKLVLIDVRQPDEWEICNLAAYGAKLIPLSQLPNRLDEIPKDQPVVLQCHAGGRSGRAQQFLMSQGYTQVLNLTGGITRWSDEVDPSMPQY